MRALNSFHLRAAYIAITCGVIAGIAGFVRLGALVIAAATGVIALAQWNQRKFERFFPLIIALVLFGLAIALPKGL